MLFIGWLLFKFPLYYFAILLVLLFMTEIFALSLAFFLSSIALVIRSEAEALFNNAEWLLGFVISSYFSIAVFPLFFRESLLYILPFSWFLEIIRKYFIFGAISTVDFLVLLKSFSINLVYFVLGFLVFTKTLKWAKRKGKIALL